MSFAQDVHSFLEAYPETRAVEVLYSDINGILRGKQCPISSLERLGETGINLPASTLLLDAKGAVATARLGEGFLGDPDAVFRAVPGTLAPIPWSATPSAQTLIAATDKSGAPLHFDPRAVLARAAEPLTRMGLTPVVALESEFYLLTPASPKPEPADPPGGMPPLYGPQCLSMETFYDFEGFIRDVEMMCEAQGVPLTTVVCEYGDAQFEANLRHVADPIRACDHIILLKRIVKAAARRMNLVASFMAKPLSDGTGSGLHAHVSLIDRDGRNVFAGESGRVRMQHAVGGVLAALTESIALFCPNANSFRRFQSDSFVPQGRSWGSNHRSVAVRLPLGETRDIRLEHRVPGADACPYLFLAAFLAGIHHGMAAKCDPGPMTHEGGPLAESVPFPARWPLALEAFAAGKVLPAYLGDAFHALYLDVKRQEEARYNAEVRDHDHEWYFRVV